MEKNTPKNQKKYFDLARKVAYCVGDAESAGYKIGNETYFAYQTNDDFAVFLNEMKSRYENAYKQYAAGDGGELMEKKYPPKMASFASSSRMIYLAARDIKGFKFEEHRPTLIGGTANLDGYISTDSCEIYVEAKCHEIFNKPNNKDIADCYLALYEYINQEDSFCFNEETKNFICKKEPLVRLDLKQLICHMLGIAHYQLSHDALARKKVRLVYFTHSLTSSEEDYIRDVNPDIVKSIKNVMDEESKDISNVDWLWLYGKIVDYLYKEKKQKYFVSEGLVSEIRNNFEFVHVDSAENFIKNLKESL